MKNQEEQIALLRQSFEIEINDNSLEFIDACVLFTSVSESVAKVVKEEVIANTNIIKSRCKS